MRARDAANGATTDTGAWWTLTDQIADTTPPTVTSVPPVNGATVISTATDGDGDLQRANRPATLTTGTFVLRNPANGVWPRDGQLQREPRRVGHADPVGGARRGDDVHRDDHRGRDGLKDVAGNHLASTFVWSFTDRRPGPWD